jgi:predicted amidohydrolase
VRVASICFANGPTLEAISAVVDREGSSGADLVALPETWLGQQDREPETLTGPTVRVMAALARRHSMVIVCPLDRWDGERRLNSAVLLDRDGGIAGVYDKVYPYWSEFDVSPAVNPGASVPVFETDLGRIGVAICFDVNFPEVWSRLEAGGAELVVWPSAYSAGSSLRAHALNHHYAIVTATQTGDCQVYDITGERILDETGSDIHVSRITPDLDRSIYHENFNVEKRDRLLAEHSDEVEMEQWLRREQWFVLRARRPGISARALAREHGLEELRDYVARSRVQIDARRGASLFR